MFEDKFKYYEEERIKFERFKSKAADDERHASHIQRENQELQQLVRDYQQQLE